MTKRYYVEVPVVMKVSVEVTADSAEEAKDKIYNNLAIVASNDGNEVEVIDWEWEMYEKVTSGNVYHGLIHSMDIQELDDEDEDED